MFKRFIAAAVVILGLTNVAQAQEVDRKDPYNMVEQAATIAFNHFKAQQAKIQKNPNLLKDIVREDLLPYVDYRYASYKVIGRNLPKTSSDQRDRFVSAFKNYLVTTYAQAFTQYDNQQVEFLRDGGDTHSSKIASVKARIYAPGRPDINITFKVRFNNKTGEWGVYDMVAEGISLLASKQAELEGLIRQKGIDYVTDELKEKSSLDITTKKENKAA